VDSAFPAAHCAPSFLQNSVPPQRGAWGNAGRPNAPIASCAEWGSEHTSVVTTGSPENHPAFPARNGFFNGVPSCYSPVCAGLVSHRLSALLLADLDASVGGVRTTRLSAVHKLARTSAPLLRPSHPNPASRDDREYAPPWGWTEIDIGVICVSEYSEYFLLTGLDRQFGVICPVG